MIVMDTRSAPQLAGLGIFLFDPGEAIPPSRPQFDGAEQIGRLVPVVDHHWRA